MNVSTWQIGLTVSLLLLSGVVLAAPAQDAASNGWTNQASLTITSDYLFRGVSQTSNSPAVQGSLGIVNDSGVYASVWASSIDFANGLELDPSVGFANTVGAISYDLGVVHYGYPGFTEEDLPFTEVYGSASWKGVSAGVAWTSDYYGGNGKSLYSHVGYGTELYGISLAAGVGQTQFDEQGMSAADGYVDFHVNVGKAFAGLQWQLSYAGSTLDDNECAAFSGDSSRCDGRFLVSVSKFL